MDMTDKQRREENIILMNFLKIHIGSNVEASFRDLTFDLEKLILNFLNIFEKDNSQWRNVNINKPNYPAIDLINDAKNKVIQVTTNADTKKINKTIKVYEKEKMNYDELIIIGFVKNSKTKKDKVSVYGDNYLINLITNASDEEQEKVYKLLTNRIPLNSLHPKDDKLAFDVVFDVIDRSAVRDYSPVEGSYDNMVKGLKEIVEIITTGKIKNKSIRAKSLVEYTENIREKLREIGYHVSEIIQICNRNKNKHYSDVLFLNRDEIIEIDNLKSKIITKTNNLAMELKINRKITGSK